MIGFCVLQYRNSLARLAGGCVVDLDERHDAGGKPRREAGRSGRGARDKTRATMSSMLCFLSQSHFLSLLPCLCVFVATPMRKTL